jgi:hypothetical protein
VTRIENTAVQNCPYICLCYSGCHANSALLTDIKFSTQFLITFFIRLLKETSLPQSTLRGLICFATWNSANRLKFRAFHYRSPACLHCRNRMRNACRYTLHLQTVSRFHRATFLQHNWDTQSPTKAIYRHERKLPSYRSPDLFTSKKLQLYQKGLWIYLLLGNLDPSNPDPRVCQTILDQI